MATSDQELIDEVRSFTGYDNDPFSDQKIQTTLETAKEEIRAKLAEPNFQFYGSDTLQADRALFWLTCLGLKLRAGEIGAAEFSIDELETQPLNDSSGEANVWFHNFINSLRGAEREDLGSSGLSHVQVSRDDRTYSFE